MVEYDANPGPLIAAMHKDLAGIQAAAKAGQVKTYGSGFLEATAAGNVRILLANPATSNHLVTVIGISVGSSVVASGILRMNPTTGLPTSALIPPMNAVVGGGLPGQLEFRSDVNALTTMGGGDTTVTLWAGANSPRELDLPAPIILRPGVSLGIGASLGAAFKFSANVTVIEEPLS